MTHDLQSIMHSYTRYWRFMSTSNINGQFIFYPYCGSSFLCFGVLIVVLFVLFMYLFVYE